VVIHRRNNIMRISKSTKTSVKAAKKVCASQERRVVYDKDGIKVATTGRDYDFIATIENDTDEEYCVEELGLCVPAHDWVGFLADDEGYADLEYFKSLGGVKACGDVKASTSTDKALQHITAAIDILGKSGKKDDVTKDIIANLAVVAMDIKASKR
jgi:hypothetical protein